MINIDSKIWTKARQSLEKAIVCYINDPNVSLIDLGLRIRTSRGHRIEPELTVRVHVHKKLYGEAFKTFTANQPHRIIDSQRIGFPIDVPETTYLLNWSSKQSPKQSHRFKFHQSLCGGICISNDSQNGFGTLGGIVCDRMTGKELILSSWHVLSGDWSENFGIDIYQPATIYDGSETNIIGKYTGSSIDANLDAALVRLNGRRSFLNKQLGIGVVSGVTLPQLGMNIIKSGAQTGVTKATITGVFGCSIRYCKGRRHLFTDLIHIVPEKCGTEISDVGDSGAWWLERSTRRVVGLHFAGSHSPESALAFSMPEVLDALKVDIFTTPTRALLPVKNCNRSKKNKADSLPQPLNMSQTDTLALSFSSDVIKHNPTDTQISTNSDALKIKTEEVNTMEVAIPPSIWRKNVARTLYKITQIWLVVVICFLFIEFGYNSHQLNQQQKEKINHLECELLFLKMIVQIDYRTQYTIKKIMTIINRYNPEMAAELKIKIAEEIYNMSLKYDHLDIELICATITHESALTWDPQITSSAGAIGLMQIMPATGIYLAREEGITVSTVEEILFDPVYNIRLGCRYLSSLVKAYNIDGGLAAYNGGEKRAEQWLRNGRSSGILHQETATYVPSILKLYQEFKHTVI